MYQGPSSSSQSSTPTPVATPPPAVTISAATASSSSFSAAYPPRPVPFSLSQHAPSRTAYTAMTRMPSVATLEQLEELPPFIASTIINCLANIYCHVVQRDADSLKVFFHHVASTVMYEVYTDELINDANHAVKAAGIVKMIDKTLAEIALRKNNSQTNPNQKEILGAFECLIIMHKNILIEALKLTSAEVKDHIMEHQNLDVDASKLTPLSPHKQDLIRLQYPTTPSPQKGKGTPKKLTDQDRVSIGKLKPVVRPLVFESSDEESDSYSESPRSAGSDSDDFSDSSDNSLDALLMAEANRGFTPFFGSMTLTQKEIFASPSSSDSDEPSSPVKKQRSKKAH